MKRIISLVLTMVLLVACLAVPVMADEGDYVWYNLLDYGYPEGMTGNGGYFPSYKVLTYDLPSESMLIRHADIIFSSSSGISSLSLMNENGETVPLTLEYLDGQLYRATFDSANASFMFNEVSLVLNFTANSNWFEVLSFRVSSQSVSTFSTNVYASGYAHKYPTNEVLSWSGPNTSEMWSYSDYESWDMYRGAFSMWVTFDDWHNYDFVDVQLSLGVADISSIIATIGVNEIPIPFEVTYLANDSSFSFYRVIITLDLRGIDHSIDADPKVLIQGNGIWDADGSQYNTISLNYARGYVFIDEISTDVFWFTQLKSWLSDQTTSITNSFTSLQSHITDRFNDLRNWVNSGYMTITLYIQTWGQNISGTITSGVDRIVSALSPSGSANDFNDKVQQQGSELENMAGAMGAVTRPDVSTAIPDIGGYLTVSGPVTLAAVFDPFWKNSYILRLLLGSLAVSVAFTVVYGGKK